VGSIETSRETSREAVSGVAVPVDSRGIRAIDCDPPFAQKGLNTGSTSRPSTPRTHSDFNRIATMVAASERDDLDLGLELARLLEEGPAGSRPYRLKTLAKQLAEREILYDGRPMSPRTIGRFTDWATNVAGLDCSRETLIAIGRTRYEKFMKLAALGAEGEIRENALLSNSELTRKIRETRRPASDAKDLSERVERGLESLVAQVRLLEKQHGCLSETSLKRLHELVKLSQGLPREGAAVVATANGLKIVEAAPRLPESVVLGAFERDESYPTTLAQVDDIAKNPEALYTYLHLVRFENGVQCPTCEVVKHGPPVARVDGRYTCCTCKRRFTITYDTPFAASRRPWGRWFRGTWYLSELDCPLDDASLATFMGFGSPRTAQKIRQEICSEMVGMGPPSLLADEVCLALHPLTEDEAVLVVAEDADGEPGRQCAWVVNDETDLGKLVGTIVREDCTMVVPADIVKELPRGHGAGRIVVDARAARRLPVQRATMRKLQPWFDAVAPEQYAFAAAQFSNRFGRLRTGPGAAFHYHMQVLMRERFTVERLGGDR